MTHMAPNSIAVMKEILTALEEGKAVQFQKISEDPYEDDWNDSEGLAPDFLSFRFRIKPLEAPAAKWRPFKTIDEFIQAGGGLGAIWLKSINTNLMLLVTGIDSTAKDVPIRVDSCRIGFATLLKNYTFANGTPCGVLKDA